MKVIRPSSQRHGRTHSLSGRVRRRRPYVWLGTLGTALVVAVVTAFGTGIGQHLFTSVIERHPISGPPIKIDSVILEWTERQAGTYVFAEKRVFSPAELQRLSELDPSQPEYANWFRSRGAVNPYSSNIKIVIEGNRPHPVQLAGIRALKRCQRPLNGTLFYSPMEGAYNDIGIGFSLHSVTSIARDYRNNKLSGDYFAEHTISLKRGEAQALQIVALPGKQYCEYTLQLTVINGSATTTETVTDHGQPFRVSAIVTHSRQGGSNALSYYRALYVGGLAPGSIHGGFTRKDPATYNIITGKP
jgi:hypothetical protein